jgi:hypothetical protein
MMRKVQMEQHLKNTGGYGVCGTRTDGRLHIIYGLQPGKEEYGDRIYPLWRLLSAEHHAIRPRGRAANRTVWTYAKAFLKEHMPNTYNRLLLNEQLFPHLREVDAIADERRRNGCPESVIVKEIVCEL